MNQNMLIWSQMDDINGLQSRKLRQLKSSWRNLGPVPLDSVSILVMQLLAALPTAQARSLGACCRGLSSDQV